METKIYSILAYMDQEEVAFVFRQYGLVSTLVVYENGRLIGVIDVDDIVNVIDEEA
jgi:magnesium transporter